jgi:hypothetical protein
MFLFWTGFGLLTLFIINNMMIRVLFSANPETADQRLIQAAQFLLPIGMLLVEYWFLDWLLISIRSIRFRGRDDSNR